ncbi:hypothetical protein BU23DRAFT_581636 [Bimuria novae-zelandiae CBS 107.79]|uniref:Zn(2)-C6 fungal-type domain-containing protein n=1 Tax=Bimuria novae-zelandiae CBS 107.79 TaxID=1447943 RepID=A0A6A5V259_9PLEO|nr:hypothetical protein BU23DRAFT_581636 [Bimuria novae-zelandiae CBS 107.79]
MPRPKKEGHVSKTRSRKPCKGRKVKCGEERPRCLNCERQGKTCDYGIRLNWGGRTKRDQSIAHADSGSSTVNSPYQSTLSFEDNVPSSFHPHSPERTQSRRKNLVQHRRSHSATSIPTSGPEIDSELIRISHTPYHSIPLVNATINRSSPPVASTAQPSPAPFGVFEYPESFDYPSPAATSFDAPNYSNASYPSVTATQSMPPPGSNTTPNSHHYTEAADLVAKQHQRSYFADSPATSDPHSSPSGLPPQPYSPFGLPLTPNSAAGVDELPVRPISGQTPNSHLLSLLSGPPGDSTRHGRQYPIGDEEYTTYGYDTGLPDLDIPQNDDINAIAIFSPPNGAMDIDGESRPPNTEVRGQDMAFEKGGYYAKPVLIRISKSLEPLPPLLLENPMNLLYFHHFLNHTARILVPHDCEKNPFRLILPEMAVKDRNIMSLLLAYSASHRARMLYHDEPANRIALWVRDVFPQLRRSLANPSTITNATLAPAIMMASLEIISPNTFEVPISWQDHLAMARQLIIARGGPRTMDKSDRAAYFLSRWFAYLDVLGSLSGNKNDQPLGPWYWSAANESADSDFQIDCLTGFTNRCVGLLAGIAELAKEVQPHRIDASGAVVPGFQPPPDVLARAENIRLELWKGLTGAHAHKGCDQRAGSDGEDDWDATEIYATNEMFHWAGLIHLYRRVYNYPATHPAVQQSVSQIVDLLFKVRRGSTAEACLLFPMFAAGCDAVDEGQREKVMERLLSVEGFGMVQVGRARRVMERVWETGRAWEGLVEGEFFG